MLFFWGLVWRADNKILKIYLHLPDFPELGWQSAMFISAVIAGINCFSIWGIFFHSSVAELSLVSYGILLFGFDRNIIRLHDKEHANQIQKILQCKD